MKSKGQPHRGQRGRQQRQQQYQHQQQLYFETTCFPAYDPNLGYDAGYGGYSQQQQMGFPADYYGAHQLQYGLYQQQQEPYDQTNYGAEEYGNFDDADYANMDDIDRAIALEEEMRQIGELQSHVDSNRADMNRVPSGAVPMRDGILSPQAAEFWFPESRDCTCCNGYKHGCRCCKGMVKTCHVCSATSAPVLPVGGTLIDAPADDETVTKPPPAQGHVRAVIESPHDEPVSVRSPQIARPVVEGSYSGNGRVPVGMPSQGGVLSRHAAEYWFPECRDCSCCHGYKHGCSCCGGVTVICKCVEGSEAASYSAGPGASSHAKVKKPCAYFESGNCRFGNTCMYLH